VFVNVTSNLFYFCNTFFTNGNIQRLPFRFCNLVYMNGAARILTPFPWRILFQLENCWRLLTLHLIISELALGTVVVMGTNPTGSGSFGLRIRSSKGSESSSPHPGQEYVLGNPNSPKYLR
jgi:hypothetical protein